MVRMKENRLKEDKNGSKLLVQGTNLSLLERMEEEMKMLRYVF